MVTFDQLSPGQLQEMQTFLAYKSFELEKRILRAERKLEIAAQQYDIHQAACKALQKLQSEALAILNVLEQAAASTELQQAQRALAEKYTQQLQRISVRPASYPDGAQLQLMQLRIEEQRHRLQQMQEKLEVVKGMVGG